MKDEIGGNRNVKDVVCTIARKAPYFPKITCIFNFRLKIIL